MFKRNQTIDESYCIWIDTHTQNEIIYTQIYYLCVTTTHTHTKLIDVQRRLITNAYILNISNIYIHIHQCTVFELSSWTGDAHPPLIALIMPNFIHYSPAGDQSTGQRESEEKKTTPIIVLNVRVGSKARRHLSSFPIFSSLIFERNFETNNWYALTHMLSIARVASMWLIAW